MGQQTVILPLPREESIRCSVKPASRNASLSRSHETRAFARATYPTLSLERAGQIQNTMNPTQWTEPKSNHPNAPTRVTSRRYSTRRASYAPNNLFKELECHMYERCGVCFQLLPTLGWIREINEHFALL
ncbi:hypothetical protein V6N13_137600 [Hibiscus sabdariffa]|uniref:Uncharacterized protein n=1 Tax=Hibiscus sabdariffa TaxID=183260 RepID=A0ABR2DKI8_9ROSI